MEDKLSPKKPFIYYGLVMLTILMLVNAFLLPALTQANIVESDYGTFLRQLGDGEVEKVELEGQVLYYTALVEGESKIHTAGLMPDDQLTNRLIAAEVPFGRVVPKELSPILSFLLSWVFPIAVFYFLGRFLMGSMTKRMGGGNSLSFGKANAKIYVQAQTGKSFSDVAGQEEAKEALTEIVDFLHNPKKYAAIGANLPKGALLVGPPGTGKTLLAKAVAGEAKVPFFSISGSEFVEMFVGMGAAKVLDLFKQANDKAPCIIFIDEIDTIGKKRGGGNFGGNDEREQTLNQLLSEMDGFDGRKGVVILAATNRPETLDRALLRPGRFDRRIPVELPDLQGREAILKVHARQVQMEPNIDCMSIARATAGASGAELANVINEAALRAVRQGREKVSQSDLMESVEVILAGYQRKNAVITPKEKEIVAYHEVGHALVAARQTDSAPVRKITIVPRTSGALGYTLQVPEDDKVLMSKEEAFNKIVTLTAGRAAEALIFGSVTTGASNDIEQATRIARAMITRYGMSEQFGMVALETVDNPYLGGDTSLACSQETAARVDSEVIKTVQAAYDKALAILKEDETVMRCVAKDLLERETLNGEEFMALLNHKCTLPGATTETAPVEGPSDVLPDDALPVPHILNV